MIFSMLSSGVVFVNDEKFSDDNLSVHVFTRLISNYSYIAL